MGDAVNSRPSGNTESERNDYDPSKGPQIAPPSSNPQQADFGYQYHQQQPQQNRQESFNMTALGGSLPAYPDYGNTTAHRYSSNASSTTVPFQMQNFQQYPGGSMAHGTNAPYAVPYNMPFQGQYSNHTSSGHSLPVGVNSSGQYYTTPGYMGQSHQHNQPVFMHSAQQYVQQGMPYSIPSGSGSFFGRGTTFTVDPRMSGQRASEYAPVSQGFGAQGRSSSVASSTGRSSVVRGPPRKPRQSGHAIWIGNLPPQTDLMSLVFHVCKETHGLESLFLISKSNCAFANFKDESSCAAAQAKIHDSRFQNVRLVSRLRRNSVGTASGVSVPTGPAALAPQSLSAVRTPSPNDDIESKQKDTTPEHSQSVAAEDKPKDKFFIVKSLTVEDLELSVRNGIWATQSHNETSLNKAYEVRAKVIQISRKPMLTFPRTADNVYLIFSANKSGEYFGYAKMISPINDDPAAAIEFAPKAQTVEDPDLPKAIPTPATEFAPKGRIIDDSARGTIFWEAEQDESEEADGVEEEDTSSGNRSDQSDNSPPTKAWGKPFQIEWVSTTRLPFYRTRGLRNPWNSNREVKIARDGTELETAIGRRLLALFHRLPSPVAPQHNTGLQLPLIGAYPPMRPYQ